jgi:hypothetical protein
MSGVCTLATNQLLDWKHMNNARIKWRATIQPFFFFLQKQNTIIKWDNNRFQLGQSHSGISKTVTEYVRYFLQLLENLRMLKYNNLKSNSIKGRIGTFTSPRR